MKIRIVLIRVIREIRGVSDFTELRFANAVEGW